MTNPNPGTNVLPAGTEAGGVFCVVPADAAGAFCVWVEDVEVCDGAVAAGVGGGDAAGGGGSATLSGDSIGVAGGGGAGAGGGGASTVVDNGLAGLTGLDILVGFVALFTHVFTVSIQEPTSGCP